MKLRISKSTAAWLRKRPRKSAACSRKSRPERRCYASGKALSKLECSYAASLAPADIDHAKVKEVGPQQGKAVSMSYKQRSALREWLVPPILIPVFLGLVVAAAVV